MAVTKSRIVETALGILDSWGLADLSMRRIADGLGVQAASIYWHYSNKQALLAAVSDAILAEVELNEASEIAVADRVAAWAHQLRSSLLAHRDAAELVAATMSTGLGQVLPDDLAREILLAGGIAAESAGPIARAWTHFVIGHVMQEQTAATMIRLGVISAASDGCDELTFNTGVALLRSGLAELTS